MVAGDSMRFPSAHSWWSLPQSRLSSPSDGELCRPIPLPPSAPSPAGATMVMVLLTDDDIDDDDGIAD